ncbi:MAG: hypothetical protein C0625_13380 [Arcobacter sp.]|nr:MAG: hypothetical protein C0625_13380 [Arcobacter sp.]
MKEKIYLLPGLMTDERLWERLIPFLKDDYELVHVALPMTDDFDLATKELEEIFQEEKINLLGFSLGAYFSSYFAIKNPNRVNKLFLVSGTPSEMKKDEIEKRKQTLKLMNTLGFKGLSHQKTISLLEKSNKDDEELIKIVKDMFSDCGEELYNIQMNCTFKRKALYNELISTGLPIKLFYSTEDRLFSHDSLEYFTDEHKHITKVSREGTSHMTPLEVPEKLSYEIKKWMR